MRALSLSSLATGFSFLAASLVAAAEPAAPPSKPRATYENLSYGPHPHQIMDVYMPPYPTSPCPVLIWYGGLWEPSKHVPDVNRFFNARCAVIGVELRTMKDAVADKVEAPVSYVQLDAVRAVQYVRSRAADWRIDPDRIMVGGGSQGTLPALYVGCSGEHANPASSDPVERLSSSVVAVAAYRSQPTIDPKRMQEWVPGVKWGAPAFGCSFEDSLKKRDELLPIINRWSPDALLHKGAAPIYFENEWGLTQPEKITVDNYKVHSPAWAVGFQKLALAARVDCQIKYPGHPTDGYADIWDFIVKKLTAPAK